MNSSITRMATSVQGNSRPREQSISRTVLRQSIGDFPLGLFLIAHLVLGLVLRQFPSLGTMHAFATVLLGIVWALSKPQIYTAFIASYIVGSEVLWRMTEASVPWEGGKYAVALVMGLSLLHHRNKRIPVFALAYFLLLLPSVLLTLEGLGISSAREQISFNLSGPLTLFVSVWFFSEMKINSDQLVRLLFVLIAPITTIAGYALLITLTTDQIRWVNDSMFSTSGGFGPNQVSTIMGLGLIAIWHLLFIGRHHSHIRWLLALIGIMLFVQGLLTFSRGGIYAAFIIICFATLHFVTDTRRRSPLLLLTLTIVPLVIYIVLPALNNFTDGFLERRFSDTGLTYRDTILLDELELFIRNPVAGVGPGMGKDSRGSASHTELTRLPAEHGSFGLVSLVILLFAAIRRYLVTSKLTLRGLRGSWVLWALLAMTNAAMRLAAVSFIYGFAFSQIVDDDVE